MHKKHLQLMVSLHPRPIFPHSPITIVIHATRVTELLRRANAVRWQLSGSAFEITLTQRSM
jgi:hypothetical protein